MGCLVVSNACVDHYSVQKTQESASPQSAGGSVLWLSLKSDKKINGLPGKVGLDHRTQSSRLLSGNSAKAFRECLVSLSPPVVPNLFGTRDGYSYEERLVI